MVSNAESETVEKSVRHGGRCLSNGKKCGNRGTEREFTYFRAGVLLIRKFLYLKKNRTKRPKLEDFFRFVKEKENARAGSSQKIAKEEKRGKERWKRK